ncbi:MULTISPECIES: hypothetical protein [Streptomyces]|uniref:hypothetical protein n=1 Tax=Streptomyces TaxID=1883 RepID=UPI002556BDC9|nr:hypothetical protein [Streptomyces sp. NBRC 13847]
MSGRGLAVDEEQPAAGTAGNEAGQELGGAGLPVDPLGGPALGGDPAALVLRVEVLHVETQHLVGQCGGLIEPFPQRDVEEPQGGDLVLRESLGAVRRRQPPFDADRRIALDPALALPPADRLARDGQLPVDGVASISSALAAASSAKTSGSVGSSIAATGKTGGFAHRRAGPVGSRSPASIRPHVVREIR